MRRGPKVLGWAGSLFPDVFVPGKKYSLPESAPAPDASADPEYYVDPETGIQTWCKQKQVHCLKYSCDEVHCDRVEPLPDMRYSSGTDKMREVPVVNPQLADGVGWCVRLSRSCNLKVCQPERSWPKFLCSSSSCKDFRKIKTGKAKVVRVTDRFANGC